MSGWGCGDLSLEAAARLILRRTRLPARPMQSVAQTSGAKPAPCPHCAALRLRLADAIQSNKRLHRLIFKLAVSARRGERFAQPHERR